MEQTKRPWGEYQVVRKDKILKIKPNSSLSLQSHRHRTEFWTVIEGHGIAVMDGDEIILYPGIHLQINPTQVHRIITKKHPLVIIEKSIGNVDEDDIVRMEDNYGRI